MRIGSRDIGVGLRPYVIAEVGVNHDGDPARAVSLIEAAARAGADAVKFQCFRADLLLSGASRLALYQRAAGARDPFDLLSKLELDEAALSQAIDRAHALDLHAIVTVFSVELVESMARLGWDAFKTASPDIINKPLIDSLLDLGRPLILSTGAATVAEIERALGWVHGAADVALMQCVSAYPTPDCSAALGGIRALSRLTDAPIGYSDHTSAIDTGALAVASGARLLEKHLTHDRAAPGPDHAASLDPAQFAEYVRLARRAWEMLGAEVKLVLPIEGDVREVSRQSIVTARAMARGQRLSREDVTIKRPGGGIEPWRLEELFGLVAARDLPADRPIQPGDLSCAPAPVALSR